MLGSSYWTTRWPTTVSSPARPRASSTSRARARRDHRRARRNHRRQRRRHCRLADGERQHDHLPRARAETFGDAGGQPAGCVQFDGYHSLSSQGGSRTSLTPSAWTRRATRIRTPHCHHEPRGRPRRRATGTWRSTTHASPARVAYLGGGETRRYLHGDERQRRRRQRQHIPGSAVFSDANAAAGNKPWCPVRRCSSVLGSRPLQRRNHRRGHLISRTGGKGSATIKIEPFSYDPNFGADELLRRGSLLPTGVTLTPDIAPSCRSEQPGGVLGAAHTACRAARPP